jgi:hypothetical protein
MSPLAVVVGFIGKIPVAGMALYNLHYVAGLMALGYEVHYVERANNPEDYYDPQVNAMGPMPPASLDFLQSVLKETGVDASRWSVVDCNGACHGAGWKSLTASISAADFVLNLADPTWFDELERCPQRAFVDGDPMFTQVAMERGSDTVAALMNYPVLFTYASRLGAPDCLVPTGGRTWITTRPVVSTKHWDVMPKATHIGAASTVMNWASWSDVEYGGRTYGQKGAEVERLIDLPSRTNRELLLAVGGPAPRDRLKAHGWRLADPLDITGTIPAYREFIAASYADLGICKHAYVASRSGWFSDRSLCYLASGRPVLHQDTGFTDWLPTGEGVLAFSSIEEAAAALRKLDEDYPRHVRAARVIAEQYFEARLVIRRMLDEAGFR